MFCGHFYHNSSVAENDDIAIMDALGICNYHCPSSAALRLAARFSLILDKQLSLQILRAADEYVGNTCLFPWSAHVRSEDDATLPVPPQLEGIDLFHLFGIIQEI